MLNYLNAEKQREPDALHITEFQQLVQLECDLTVFSVDFTEIKV